jgi:KDO2-lipid IV(A) lauroyltransferase
MELTKKTCIHWGKSIIEFMYLPKIKRKEMIKEVVDTKDASEIIKQELEKGKGCLIATGHFGMWEYVGASLSQNGVPLSVIMRPLDNRILDRFVSGIRASFGTKNIPKRHMKGMVKALKSNEALVFLIDQNSISKNSVFVPLFGKLASTSTGLTYFLNKYPDTPVIYVYPYRDKDNIHRAVAVKVETLSSKKYDDFARKNMANLTRITERFINNYPEQWLWFHPRWSKKPTKQEEELYNYLSEKDLEEFNKKQSIVY